MRFIATITLAMLSLVSPGCWSEVSGAKAPVAKVVPTRLEKHGQVRTDDYYWLRERDNPEVIAYLKAENNYTEAAMQHTRDLQRGLFAEFKARIKQTDMSVPYRKNGYYYYTRIEEGKEYPIHCRKKNSLDAPEEIMIDVNKVASGHKFCALRGPDVSPDNRLMAYAVDTAGRRFYDVRFRDLATGEELDDVIPKVTGNLAWANDSKTVFYSKQHPETLRRYEIWRHVLGTVPPEDRLIYEEKDETFNCGIGKTKSEKYLMIGCGQTLSTEYRFLDASRPLDPFRVIQPRRHDLEYHVEHFRDHFYIRTNLDAKNFRLMKTPVDRTRVEHWKDVIPHREDVFLADFEIFSNHLVVQERKAGLLQLRISPWSGEGEHYIDFGEPAYDAYATANYEFDTPVVRYSYSSMTTPPTVYDYNMNTREKKLLKREEVLGGFDTGNYTTERIYAAARDGAKVPISLVYRKQAFRRNGNSPLLLYGYGSYGSSTDARFNPLVVSLLDRGFVYAIAHVRGGQEMGRQWYEDGKLQKKKNTFTDFIDCADHLIREQYADPNRIFAIGGSAGGLLMGAVINMRPELWKGVIANVPFVDVVTTMLDEEIPLTTSEYDEWGDPNKKAYYDYMLSYSPYDQVGRRDYPSLLVLTSLHDSQVQYWEPAKWVAKLRALKTGNNLLLLKTEMEAGHGGVSGRYKQYRERAFQYAFLLDLAGIRK